MEFEQTGQQLTAIQWRTETPSSDVDCANNTCPVCLQNTAKSSTAAGSVVVTFKISRACICASAFLVRKIGIGQRKPDKSSVRTTCASSSVN